MVNIALRAGRSWPTTWAWARPCRSSASSRPSSSGPSTPSKTSPPVAGKTIASVFSKLSPISKHQGSFPEKIRISRRRVRFGSSDDVGVGGSSSDQKRFAVGMFLIVCPASVLRNWEQEFERWGYFVLAKYYK